MKTLAACTLALTLMAASAITLRAQGPSAYKGGETINGQITRIDQATKTIEVTPSTPGGAGMATPIEYQAKDSTELAKFHIGDAVSGKVSKDTPPKLTNLKAEKKSSGMKDSTGMSGMKDTAAKAGGMAPR